MIVFFFSSFSLINKNKREKYKCLIFHLLISCESYLYSLCPFLIFIAFLLVQLLFILFFMFFLCHFLYCYSSCRSCCLFILLFSSILSIEYIGVILVINVSTLHIMEVISNSLLLVYMKDWGITMINVIMLQPRRDILNFILRIIMTDWVIHVLNVTVMLIRSTAHPSYCTSAILPIRPTATSDLRQL